MAEPRVAAKDCTSVLLEQPSFLKLLPVIIKSDEVQRGEKFCFHLKKIKNLCMKFDLGEKILQVSHKHVRLLLYELLAAGLQVPIHVFLGVDVVLFYLRRTLA